MNETVGNSENRIELVIPAASDYVKIIRMAVAGMGSILNLDIGEIENLKLAAGEACYGMLYEVNPSPARITFIAEVKDALMTVIVTQNTCTGESGEDPAPGAEAPDEMAMEREIGRELLSHLMDSVDYRREGGSNSVTMTRALQFR